MQINRQTYEEFFLLYADGELNIEEKKGVEEFVARNPDLEPEFMLLLQTIMLPDESIIFENKELLYKEEEETKVVPFRWFRVAVAAILLFAFGFLGWLYFGEKETISRNPVAIVEKPLPVKSEQKRDNSSAETASGHPEAPLKYNDEKLQKAASNNKTSNASVKTKKSRTKEVTEFIYQKQNINTEPAISNNLPDAATFEQDIAKTPSTKENIDVTVKAREIENTPEPENNNVYYTQMEIEHQPNNDMIYFANTSLSKKTKLRGVFRKATRFLDKVTSFQ